MTQIVRIVFTSGLACLVLCCKEVQRISDVFVPPSPREVYARSFKENDPEFARWQRAFEKAKRDSVFVGLPYLEAGNFSRRPASPHSYVTLLNRGEELRISVRSARDSVPVFLDVYPYLTPDSLAGEPVLSEKRYGFLPAKYPVDKTGRYLVVIQPGITDTPDLRIELYTRPTLAFPVAGVNDRAIQSFWGDPRSGGTRTHEGVDIFAPRATPVLAVADGHIRFTGERGLGGKQVWLRSGAMGSSFYYAHLDSIAVAAANRVNSGDTLGFVGNTGNASTTVPHLHFGIYTRGGPVDPLPYIRSGQRVTGKVQPPESRVVVKSSQANFRLGPSTQSGIHAILSHPDTLSVLGRTPRWYHVLTEEGTRGYVHGSLLGEIKDPGVRSTSF